MFAEDQYTVGTHAETAAMFGDLVIQNLQQGADVETVAEWARYAARYGAKALRRSEDLRQFAHAYAGDVLQFHRALVGE